MQIARVYFDVHMGQNFNGLLKICHKSGFRPEATGSSYTVFINSKRTKFKILVGNKYLVYYDNQSRQISLDAIKYLPDAFNGGAFSFDVAVKRSIDKALRRGDQ